MHVLYLGRIEPNKGMDYMYDAAKKLKEQNIDFVLHFAGVEQNGCNYIERFETLLGKQFVYEGIVSGKKKTELLQSCMVFLLPSFYEGLPISLLECMSFGIVPVTTDVGSISDFVKDGETGLFIKQKDADSIVESISKLYADISFRQKLAESARQTIFSKLDPVAYITQLNAIYNH